MNSHLDQAQKGICAIWCPMCTDYLIPGTGRCQESEFLHPNSAVCGSMADDSLCDRLSLCAKKKRPFEGGLRRFCLKETGSCLTLSKHVGSQWPTSNRIFMHSLLLTVASRIFCGFPIQCSYTGLFSWWIHQFCGSQRENWIQRD